MLSVLCEQRERLRNRHLRSKRINPLKVVGLVHDPPKRNHSNIHKIPVGQRVREREEREKERERERERERESSNKFANILVHFRQQDILRKYVKT